MKENNDLKEKIENLKSEIKTLDKLKNKNIRRRFKTK